MAPVRELLASSSAELQSQLLGSVLKSDRKVLTRLAADVECLRALDLWMIDLIPDTRAFQNLEDILQVRFQDPGCPVRFCSALSPPPGREPHRLW